MVLKSSRNTVLLSFDQFNNSAQGRHTANIKSHLVLVHVPCNRIADPMRRDASRSRARIFNGEPCQVFLQCRSRGPGGRCHKRIAAGQVYCVHERNGSCRNSGKNHPECSSTWAQRQRSRHATFAHTRGVEGGSRVPETEIETACHRRAGRRRAQVTALRHWQAAATTHARPAAAVRDQ